MKAFCPISGLTYQIGDTSLFKHSPKVMALHPIFTIPYASLDPIIRQWHLCKLGEIETKLLCLAIFNATTLVIWDSPAQFDKFTQASATKNIPALIDFMSFIGDRTQEFKSRYFVKVRISENTCTCDLSLLDSYISTWQDNISEYFTNATRARAKATQELKDNLLTRLLFKHSQKPNRYIKHLARWARAACEFPTHNIPVTLSGKFATCADYWEYCLIAMGNRDIDGRIYNISRGDILDLQEWVLDHILLDNIYAFCLSELISKTLEDISFFTSGNFNIVENRAAQQEFITDKPLIVNEPQRKDYISNLEYIRALALYNTQQQALASLASLAELRVEDN
jgi:hypothetical protein